MTDIGGAGEAVALLTAAVALLVVVWLTWPDSLVAGGVLLILRLGDGGRTLRCLLRGHRTHVTYTPTEGQVQCSRCQTVLESWKVLRPEQAAQALREQQQFWARIDARREPTRSGLRLVR